MKSIKAYIEGVKTLFRFPKIWGIYYWSNLVIAVLTAIPFFQYLNAQLGQSAVIERLLDEFDFRIISDVLAHYGAGILPFFNQSFLLVGVFLLMTAFLQGGILYYYNRSEEQYKSSIFWSNCTQYFGRILRLSLVFILGHLLAFVLAWLLFQNLSKGMSPDRLQSEATVVMAACMVGIPYLIVAATIGMWQDYAKTILVREELNGVLQAIKKAFRFCVKRCFACFFLMVLNVLTLLFCYGLYKTLHLPVAPDAGLKLVLLFCISQTFIFMRMGVKLWNLASVAEMVGEE